MTRFFTALLLICVAAGQAPAAIALRIAPAPRAIVLVDWQYPGWLPPRFRNHCSTEYFTGRAYCANHCGSGYQFFYCSEDSFGCCGLGRGYCDFHGILRCNP